MISTEESVRDVILGAISGITETLGTPNIQDHLLQWHPVDAWAEYLMTDVDGERRARCWAVQVTGTDDFFASGSIRGNITSRTYSIEVAGYYDARRDGEGRMGVNLLIEHMRAVRNAIRGLTTNLFGTVTRVSGVSGLSLEQIRGSDDETGAVIVGRTIYTAISDYPDY